MPDLTTIRCPSCGHPINDHMPGMLSNGTIFRFPGCQHSHGPGGSGTCICREDSNSITYALVFGQLTPPPPERPAPLPDPVVPDARRRRTRLPW